MPVRWHNMRHLYERGYAARFFYLHSYFAICRKRGKKLQISCQAKHTTQIGLEVVKVTNNSVTNNSHYTVTRSQRWILRYPPFKSSSVKLMTNDDVHTSHVAETPVR